MILKNKIGRPSKKDLRKRKIFRVLLISAIVVTVFGVSYGVKSLFANKIVSLNKNASVIDLKFYGSTGGYVYKNKYYQATSSSNFKTSNALSFSSIDTNYIYTAADGNTKVGMRVGNVPSSIYNGKIHIPYRDKYYSYYEISTYNSNKSLIKSSKIYLKKSTNYGTIQIDKNVNYAIVNFYEASTSGYSKAIFIKKIYISTFPSINTYFSSSSKKSKPTLKSNSNGVVEYIASAIDTYYTSFKVTNNARTQMYYKWFTYSNLDSSYKNISYEGACEVIKSNQYDSSNSYVITGKGLDVSASYPQRMGHLRLYTSADLCKNDTSYVKGKKASKALSINSYSNGSISVYNSSATVKYSYLYAKNSQGYNVLNFDLKGMTNIIGSQRSDWCNAYSLAYGAYILLGNKKPSEVTLRKNPSDSYPTVNSANASFGASDGTKAKSYTNFYNIVVNKINAGIPVRIHVSHSSGQHYVLIVGYKSSVTSVSNAAQFRNSVWILDPYGHGSGYGHNSLTYKATSSDYSVGNIWSGPMNKDNLATNLTLEYRTWASRTSAK